METFLSENLCSLYYKIRKEFINRYGSSYICQIKIFALFDHLTFYIVFENFAVCTRTSDINGFCFVSFLQGM